MAEPMFNDFAALKAPEAKASEPVKPIVAPAPADKAPEPEPQPAAPKPESSTPAPSTPSPTSQEDNHSLQKPGSQSAAEPGEQQTPQGQPGAPAVPGDAAQGIIDPLADNTPEHQASSQHAEIASRAAEQATRRLLEELGIDSVEELRSRLTPPKEQTPEEKKRTEDLFRADVQKYAIEKMGMTPEDFVRVENTRQMNDTDLVFGYFKEKWMAANKDKPELQGKDLDQEARYEFDSLFHVTSENERLQQLGQQSLKETADSLRASQEGRIKEAEDAYREVVHLRQQTARFKQTLQSTIRQTLPQELTWNIEGDEKVRFSLDKLDKKALEKYLVSQSNFDLFLQKGSQETAKSLEQQIRAYIAINHMDDIVSASIQTAMSAGLKKGAVGAKAPFNSQPLQKPEQDAKAVTKDDDAKVRSVIGPDRV